MYCATRSKATYEFTARSAPKLGDYVDKLVQSVLMQQRLSIGGHTPHP